MARLRQIALIAAGFWISGCAGYGAGALVLALDFAWEWAGAAAVATFITSILLLDEGFIRSFHKPHGLDN